MEPKIEIINANKEKLDSILDEWGYAKTSPLRESKKFQIVQWLMNYAPSEIEDMILMAQKIQYKEDYLIRNAITTIAKEIASIFSGNLEDVKFFALGESSSSSGSMYLYDFRKELRLPESSFPNDDFRKYLDKVNSLVFFDDIIGSGSQASRFFKKHLSKTNAPLYYSSVFGFSEGIQFVKNNTQFKHVFSGITLSSEERAFSSESKIFSDIKTKTRIEDICQKYGKLLYPLHPLGYDNSQSLIVFPHNTPNNTLPIIWASPENEKENGIVWSPLWERKKVLTPNLSNEKKSWAAFQYELELVGREDELIEMENFFTNNKQHFFLLYGVGGIGKTHLISTVLQKANHQSTYFKCNKDYTLNKLFRICNISLPKDDSGVDKLDYFITKFITSNTSIILDDFYEVIDEELRTLLPRLASVTGGKILIISRAIPIELSSIDNVYRYRRLGPLPKKDFFALLDNYSAWKNREIKLSNKDKEKIYSKTEGYPLAGHFVIRLLALREDIDEIFENLIKFDAELDPEGKQFSGRLLDVIFSKERRDEIELLCQFSAYLEPVYKDAIALLPSFKQLSFENLIRKDLIWLVEGEKFSTHALIREFAYEKLNKKYAIHETIGKYYEDKAVRNGIEDIDNFELSLNHYRVAGEEQVQQFKNRMFKLFRSENVKKLLNENIKSTIKNLKYVNQLYPEYLPYYTELGIAYRENNQLNDAIEVLEKGLKVNSENIPTINELAITYRRKGRIYDAIKTINDGLKIKPSDVKFLNQLGIAYRQYKDFDKSVEVLEKAISKEARAVHSLNELGISYRYAGMLDKSIEALKKRLSIEVDEIRSMTELSISLRIANRVDEAITILERATNLYPRDLKAKIRLLENYIFFTHDKQKASELLKSFPHEKLNLRQSEEINKLRTYTEQLESIINLTSEDEDLLNQFTYDAVGCGAYYYVIKTLPFLIKKFPANIHFRIRYGKTLLNEVLKKYEDGLREIEECIEILKKSNDKDELNNLMVFYLYQLLDLNKTELLDVKCKEFQMLLADFPNYQRFYAKYLAFQGKPVEQVLKSFELAYRSHEDFKSKIMTLESLLDYLNKNKEKITLSTLNKWEAEHQLIASGQIRINQEQK